MVFEGSVTQPQLRKIKSMDVLLAEDNKADQHMMELAFQSSSVKAKLLIVEDGQSAISFVKREGEFSNAPRPDLIFLDLNLPKKNGIEVLTEIRKYDHLKKIPIVILTGSTFPSDKIACAQLESTAYLPKPIGVDGLKALIELLPILLRKD